MNVEKELIMLIENNPDDEARTILALRKNNFQSNIVVARNGTQALDMLTGEGNITLRPDLIFLELDLPDINGLEILKNLRHNQSTRHIPIAILITSGKDADLANSYDNGTSSYIRKPVSDEDFVEQIGYVVKYWFVCNKNLPTEQAKLPDPEDYRDQYHP